MLKEKAIVSMGSKVTVVARSPSLRIKFKEDLLNVPSNSMAI